MNKKTVKLTSVLLSAAMILGMCTMAGCGRKEENRTAVVTEAAQETETTVSAHGKETACKDETVYVFSGADGKVQNLIVSSWLKNPDRAAVLQDASELKDLENVKGTEEFTTGKDNSLTWDAQGKDIYYQGTTDRKLPVDLKITYRLDGKTISPEKLAGQSGRVTIRFDYENHETRKIGVNGKEEKIYVPFIMATGILLDPEVFRNVEVKNGQMENMGNEIAVIGFAFPGMQENLDIDEEKLDIPDFIEITADTDHFEMGETMTVATTSFLKDFNTEDLDVRELKDMAKKLTDGMSQLMDGAGKLYDGLNTLLDQTGALVDGVGQLSVGAASLQTGVDTLTGGVSQLQDGASQLSAGLTALDANSAALTSGAAQVFNSLLSSATTQLNAAGLSVPGLSIGNYASVLNGLIASLDETAVYQSALQQVTAGVEAKRGEIEVKVTEAVRQQVSAEALPQVTAAVRGRVSEAVQAQEPQFRAAVLLKTLGMTPEEYQQAVDAGLVSEEQQAALEAGITAAMEAEVARQMDSEEIRNQIAAVTEQTVHEKMGSPEVQGIIAQNTEAQVQKAISDTMASPEIQNKLQAAAEGAKAVIALKSSLDSYNGFYLGIQAYTAGVAGATAGAADLNAGAESLKGGMGALSAGVGSLNTGIQTINGKMPQMKEGITALRDGSGTLRDGLIKLMDEGIRKIANLAEDDLSDLTARLSASIEAGNSYESFSGKAEEASGTVKFIYRTEEITVPAESGQ